MLYVILAGAVLVIWLVAVDRPKLKMEFKDGVLVHHKGHLPHGFGHNCKEIAHKTPFSGVIKVYSARSGAKLSFSKGVPHKAQQRIRNVFPHQGFKSTGKNRA